jgi:hypothetical protein
MKSRGNFDQPHVGYLPDRYAYETNISLIINNTMIGKPITITFKN